jgi:ubiquinone/menaquinone biosynthesis C-methylase UbiE
MSAKGTSKQASYTHGHHDTVLHSHLWRTAANSAAYLLPYLKPGQAVLDVGCGPGTISSDLATLVGPGGHVVGIDSAETVVEQAQDLARSRGISNVEFRTANVFALPFAAGTFDVVHAHQVLQHVGDASAALREMRRVAKPGGVVAARDMTHFLHWPEVPELVRFDNIFHAVAGQAGALPRAGREYRRLAREAGFEGSKVRILVDGQWCFTTEEELSWWCGK